MDETCTCGHKGGVHDRAPPHRCCAAECPCRRFLAQLVPSKNGGPPMTTAEQLSAAMSEAIRDPSRHITGEYIEVKGPSMAAATPEPPPRANASEPLWEQVIADARARDDFGRAKYGIPLQAWNGRRALVDAYQESLDKTVYLKQAVVEREAIDAVLRRILKLAVDGDQTSVGAARMRLIEIAEATRTVLR